MGCFHKENMGYGKLRASKGIIHKEHRLKEALAGKIFLKSTAYWKIFSTFKPQSPYRGKKLTGTPSGSPLFFERLFVVQTVV